MSVTSPVFPVAPPLLLEEGPQEGEEAGCSEKLFAYATAMPEGTCMRLDAHALPHPRTLTHSIVHNACSIMEILKVLIKPGQHLTTS